MIQPIRIDGLYDQITILKLMEKGIHSFSFDLRPKSFNFLQEYKLIEIIQSLKGDRGKYYLHFDREKDFVIQKIIEDLKRIDFTEGHVLLEFSDEKDGAFYDSFKTPYLVHVQEGSPFDKFEKSTYISGLVFPYSYLEHLKNVGRFGDFILELNHLKKTGLKNKSIEYILKLDWTDSPFPSLYEYMNFDILSLPINTHVEYGYRNVDIDLLVKSLKPFLKDE